MSLVPLLCRTINTVSLLADRFWEAESINYPLEERFFYLSNAKTHFDQFIMSLRYCLPTKSTAFVSARVSRHTLRHITQQKQAESISSRLIGMARLSVAHLTRINATYYLPTTLLGV